MKNKFAQFMYGRYGLDDYGRFLSIMSIVFIFVGSFTSSLLNTPNLFTVVGILLLFYCYYRILSRKIHRRTQENYVYHGAKNEFMRWISKIFKTYSYSKTHKIFKCPSCKQCLRVPKGRGKISITCKRCNHEFIRKS